MILSHRRDTIPQTYYYHADVILSHRRDSFIELPGIHFGVPRRHFGYLEDIFGVHGIHLWIPGRHFGVPGIKYHMLFKIG